MALKKYMRKAFAAALALAVMTGSMVSVGVSAAEPFINTAALTAVSVPNSSTVSAENITLGQSVTITGNSDLTDCTFAYFYKKESDTKWVTKKNFSTTKSVTLKPASAVTYNICVKVKDSRGVVYKKYFDVKVSPELVNKSKISSASITKGQKITMSGIASGGSGGYTYAFFCKKASDTKWVTKQNFSTNKSVVFTPAAATDYDICIKVMDSNGAVTKKYLTLSVKQLVNHSSIDTDEDSITLTGSASGGTGSYTYAYYVKKPDASSWTTLRNFGSVKSVKYTPDDVGKYQFCVKVKDITGTVVKQYFTVEVVGDMTSAEEVIDSIIDDSMTELQMVKAIHDWLVNNVEYDIDNYNNGTIPDESYTAEGLFENRRAVCDGYAKAFVQMAEYAGFEVLRVTGTGHGENHAWNQIKVDGKWYNVDVTWDDPVSSTDIHFDNLSYEYFLIPDSVIRKDHAFDTDTERKSCTTAQPVDELIPEVLEDDLGSNEYWYYCEDTDEVAAAAEEVVAAGQSEFTVIYPNSTLKAGDVLNTAIQAAKKGAGCNYTDWRFDGYTQMTISFR